MINLFNNLQFYAYTLYIRLDDKHAEEIYEECNQVDIRVKYIPRQRCLKRIKNTGVSA